MTTKKWIITISICLALLLFLITSVSIRNNFVDDQYGECISIAFFEKWKMWTVDKVVIETDTGKRIEITDSELVEDILDETTVATHATQSKHGNYHRWIYLYDGDKLVRSMEWTQCCDTVEVYEADAGHWFITPDGSTADVGFVYLSDELVDEIDALLEAG